jgi:hypothetical protein
VAVTLYFSDCQVGASTGCVAGNNANAGTSAAAPKRDLSGVNLNTLGAGSQLRFARGGVWTGVAHSLNNTSATIAAPLVFTSYVPDWGSAATPRPELRTMYNGVAFNIGGSYGNSTLDGGYTFRDLKLSSVNGGNPSGIGDNSRAFLVHSSTRAVLIENTELTNFGIAIEIQNLGVGNQGFVLRNSHIHRNSRMGILGDAHDLVIEDNLIEANNFSGIGFNHGLYLGSHALARNAIVRNNRFVNNSAVNGVCTGGNLTVHGMWDGLVIEGNTISQTQATYGCWGISVNDGYTEAEYFRNTTIRANTMINIECAICVRSAPGALIERNVIRSNQSYLPSGVVVVPPNGANDDAGVNAAARDNVICFTDPNPNQAPVRVSVSGGTVSGTVYRTGADALTGACAP